MVYISNSKVMVLIWMRQLNKYYVVSFLSLFVIFLLSCLVLQDKKEFTVRTLEPVYSVDLSDKRKLVGMSHNVFVGTVKKQLGAKTRGLGPETQFEVEVLENIKGDLKGQVTVNQQGGYQDGTLYVMEGDSFSKGGTEEGLLDIGGTYLFATRYSEKENWYTIISYPGANKYIGDGTLADEQFHKIIEANEMVQELTAAYPNEILSDADVKHGNIRNSYQMFLKMSEPKPNDTPAIETLNAKPAQEVTEEQGVIRD